MWDYVGFIAIGFLFGAGFMLLFTRINTRYEDPPIRTEDRIILRYIRERHKDILTSNEFMRYELAHRVREVLALFDEDER